MHMPMSDAQREAVRAETEKERERDEAAATVAAQLKREADAERDWYMQRHGLEPVTVADVLARADRGLRKLDKQLNPAQELDDDERAPRTTRWETKQMQQAAAAKALIEPASKADVGKLSATVSQLKAKLHSLSGRSEEVSPGASRRTESPEEYARDSIHIRNGGGIVRGPY
jgi:hypothetical protein